jgi:hypothetical protein
MPGEKLIELLHLHVGQANRTAIRIAIGVKRYIMEIRVEADEGLSETRQQDSLKLFLGLLVRHCCEMPSKINDRQNFAIKIIMFKFFRFGNETCIRESTRHMRCPDNQRFI